MTFTQKHFIAIASVVRHAVLDDNARKLLVNDFVAVFKIDNPNFDERRFRDAATPKYATTEN